MYCMITCMDYSKILRRAQFSHPIALSNADLSFRRLRKKLLRGAFYEMTS